MTPWDGGQPLLILFLFPIVVSAYLGGLGPGLLATGITAVVTDYFLLPPTYTFGFGSPAAFAHWLFLLLVGVLISVLFDELQQWRDKTAARSTERRHAATERKVRVGFAIALAFLGAIGIVSYLSVVRFTENAQLVAHSQLVMSNIDALVATTFETESAQRAYVLTGEEPFAADYTRAMGRVEGLVQQLRDAVSTEPAQLARVEPLAEAVRARMRAQLRAHRPAPHRRPRGRAAASSRRTRTGPASSLQTRIRDARAGNESRRDRAAQRARARREPERAGHAGGHRRRQRARAHLRVAGALRHSPRFRRPRARRGRAQPLLRSVHRPVRHRGARRPFQAHEPRGDRHARLHRRRGAGLDYMEMQHPDDRARTDEVVDAQVNRGERVDNFESRFRHKDGTYRMLSWRSKPHGGLMYATARDVTDAARRRRGAARGQGTARDARRAAHARAGAAPTNR